MRLLIILATLMGFVGGSASIAMGASIQGKVLLCETEEPLPGITITTGTSRTFSNAQGHFKLEGLAASVHDVTFKLEGFETTEKRYDLTKAEEIESIVKLVDAYYGGLIVCSRGNSRAIRLIILDASTNQPIPFAFVSPYKRCSKHSGQILLNCEREKTFSVIFDIKADGYSRWRHRVDFPPEKTEVKIYLKK